MLFVATWIWTAPATKNLQELMMWWSQKNVIWNQKFLQMFENKKWIDSNTSYEVNSAGWKWNILIITNLRKIVEWYYQVLKVFILISSILWVLNWDLWFSFAVCHVIDHRVLMFFTQISSIDKIFVWLEVDHQWTRLKDP